MLNAGRKYLGSGDLSGQVFVTSGLGGMSGAQGKASVIAGCVGVIAVVRVRGQVWGGEWIELSSSVTAQCLSVPFR